MIIIQYTNDIHYFCIVYIYIISVLYNNKDF